MDIIICLKIKRLGLILLLFFKNIVFCCCCFFKCTLFNTAVNVPDVYKNKTVL